MSEVQKSEIVIIYNSVDYFQSEIVKRGYSISELYKVENLFVRFLKKICKKFNLSDRFLYGKWKNHLRGAKYILLFSPIEQKVVDYIKSKCPTCKLIYWYWNPAYRIGRPTPKLYESCELWTFDLEDANRYKMKYNNTFYFDNIEIKKEKSVYDILFVGRNKHRQEALVEIKREFEQRGLKTFFHIVPNRNEDNKEKINPISYKKYLELVAQSKAILDIMPPSQVGLTLRPMESLFLEKKIITDNIHISREAFYHPRNVFIVGKDNFDSLVEFLDSPFVPVDNKIKELYDFNNWINRIIQKTEFSYST